MKAKNDKKIEDLSSTEEQFAELLKSRKISARPGFTDSVMAKLKVRQRARVFNVWKYASAALGVLLVAVSLLLVNEIYTDRKVTVELTLDMPEAKSVSLAGDFNNWDAETAKLVNKDGVWTIKLRVKPGRYQYAFVIDGKKWMPDPGSEQYVDSGFGEKNSILDTFKL